MGNLRPAGAVEAGRLDLGKFLVHVLADVPPARGLGAFLEEEPALGFDGLPIRAFRMMRERRR